MNGVLIDSSDGVRRCSCAGEQADSVACHDGEWGRPVADDHVEGCKDAAGAGEIRRLLTGRDPFKETSS